MRSSYRSGIFSGTFCVVSLCVGLAALTPLAASAQDTGLRVVPVVLGDQRPQQAQALAEQVAEATEGRLISAADLHGLQPAAAPTPDDDVISELSRARTQLSSMVGYRNQAAVELGQQILIRLLRAWRPLVPSLLRRNNTRDSISQICGFTIAAQVLEHHEDHAQETVSLCLGMLPNLSLSSGLYGPDVPRLIRGVQAERERAVILGLPPEAPESCEVRVQGIPISQLGASEGQVQITLIPGDYVYQVDCQGHEGPARPFSVAAGEGPAQVALVRGDFHITVEPQLSLAYQRLSQIELAQEIGPVGGQVHADRVLAVAQGEDGIELLLFDVDRDGASFERRETSTPAQLAETSRALASSGGINIDLDPIGDRIEEASIFQLVGYIAAGTGGLLTLIGATVGISAWADYQSCSGSALGCQPAPFGDIRTRAGVADVMMVMGTMIGLGGATLIVLDALGILGGSSEEGEGEDHSSVRFDGFGLGVSPSGGLLEGRLRF